MQSDMKKKGKSTERKKPKSHGLQMTCLGMMGKGLELRVCLAGWRNIEVSVARAELRERGCGQRRGQNANSVVMTSIHPSRILCWALESNVKFSPQTSEGVMILTLQMRKQA